jgi:cbb3-type cytochrome oxidase maturation protein
MNIVYFMVPMALLLAIGFVWAFISSVRGGQYDDLETPAHRMLFDDSETTSQRSVKETPVGKTPAV